MKYFSFSAEFILLFNKLIFPMKLDSVAVTTVRKNDDEYLLTNSKPIP